MSFIKDLYHDEIRNGWLVKSDMKKVWQRQLEIWQKVDKICRKHKITYWAAYGTLIGAACHKGFIPWDEDFDIVMMRPDYNRFCAVVETELKGTLIEIERKIFSITKIAHSKTTLLGHENINKQTPKGLMIDIFPLDIAEDSTRDSFFAINGLNELLGTIYNYPAIVKHVQGGGKTVNDWSVIEMLNSIPEMCDQFKFLAIYAENLFKQSSTVNWIEEFVTQTNKPPFKKSWFRETIYLPFESVKLPVPIDYDKLLTSYYGDWHKPVIDRSGKLGFIHSADIPYREFLQRVNLDFMFPKE